MLKGLCFELRNDKQSKRDVDRDREREIIGRHRIRREKEGLRCVLWSSSQGGVRERERDDDDELMIRQGNER